jgi:uncharacterized protein (TIGR00255 family)
MEPEASPLYFSKPTINMTCSMTAFARKEKQADWGYATWELRSVNHRYLDISLSLPEPLSFLEPLIRKQLTTQMHRGRVDVKLRYKAPANKAVPIEVDETLACAIIQTYAKLATLTQSPQPLNPSELLRWPQLLKLPDMAYEKLQPDLLALFSETLSELCQARAHEGSAILQVIEQRLIKLQTLINAIKEQLPHILSLQREKILARLSDIKTSLDPNRLEQEMLLFTQKTDIAEELDRLQIHLNEFKKLLKKNQTQGKQLDFMLQEMNREANTLTSKSLNADISLMAVNAKLLIEEIREQVQNVE